MYRLEAGEGHQHTTRNVFLRRDQQIVRRKIFVKIYRQMSFGAALTGEIHLQRDFYLIPSRSS